MSLTVARSVALDSLRTLKCKSKFNSVILRIKPILGLFIFSFIFVNCSSAQNTPPPKTTTKTIESSDKVNSENQRFESEAGNFSINISQKPIHIRSLEASEGEEPGKQFLWQFEKTTYTAMYSAFNKKELSQAFDDMNSGFSKGALRAGGKLISEKEISFGKYKGKEFRWIAANSVTYIARNYLVNNIGYMLTAGFVDKESEKEAIEVLDSFKLLNEKD